MNNNDPSRTIVLKNAQLIDGTGADPRYGVTVVIQKDRILEVIDGPPGVLPGSADVIDCRGGHLLPGLIDAHVHIICVDADIGNMMRRNYTSLLTIRALSVMKETLDQGFTCIRDCGGADAGFRVAVDNGYAIGPRIQVSGRHLSMTGGHGDGRWPTELFAPAQMPAGFHGIVVDGVDACRKAAREQLRQGVDFIKVMAGGGCMSPSDAIHASQYSLDELKAIVWEAQSAGTYVSAHCYSDLSILNSLEAGIRSIEHANLMTNRSAEAIKEKKAFVVPTLAAYALSVKHGNDLGIPDTYMKKIAQAYEQGEHALSIAHQKGCAIASGSDLLGPMQRFRASEIVLKAKVLGPMGAIVATTKTNSELLGCEKDLGTIAAGKYADLILVAGDPLEDITLLQDYNEKISLIMSAGRLHKHRV